MSLQKLTITFEDEHSNTTYETSYKSEDLGLEDECFTSWLMDGAWEAIGFTAISRLFEPEAVKEIPDTLTPTQIASALFNSFEWSETKQGYDYWESIYDKLIVMKPQKS